MGQSTPGINYFTIFWIPKKMGIICKYTRNIWDHLGLLNILTVAATQHSLTYNVWWGWISYVSTVLAPQPPSRLPCRRRVREGPCVFSQRKTYQLDFESPSSRKLEQQTSEIENLALKGRAK